MKVWLDDAPIRDPIGDWMIVRTPEEAIELLKTERVEIISLDHDLGIFRNGREHDGNDVVMWMCETKTFPPMINIHTWNSVEARKMTQTLNRYAPLNCILTMWQYSKGISQDLENMWEKSRPGR